MSDAILEVLNLHFLIMIALLCYNIYSLALFKIVFLNRGRMEMKWHYQKQLQYNWVQICTFWRNINLINSWKQKIQKKAYHWLDEFEEKIKRLWEL